MKKFRRAQEYVLAAPLPARGALEVLRKTIQQAAPKAEERISYNIPAFEWNGMLVWYAAFQKHVGFYPKASAIVAFKAELKGYKTSKGAIQFPMGKPIPMALVKRIVRFRLAENEKQKKSGSR